MKIIFTYILLISVIYGDCIYGAKDKTSFVILDRNSIVLKGSYGSDILIKTYCYIYSYSEVSILKDSFCDYEDSILYVDGEICDANQVKRL